MIVAVVGVGVIGGSVGLAARRRLGATVRGIDPHASEALAAGAIDEAHDDLGAALEGADAAVVVTEWPELRELDWAEAQLRMRGNVVVDGRNLLDADEMRSLGFAYEGIGRAVS